ncbi:uncharacterized protein LOC134273287 [Saccostrea cucullata]|uniref:uncharacterized protein LOC134273287 n=1 Tax=Saccostrea cuccullata TaxID=36930 RepID=UPI002ED0828F
MILSEEIIKSTAEATKRQRTNPMWAVMRKNRITASNFGAVLNLKRKRLTASLKKRLMSSYNLESVKSIAWGIIHEDDALKKYQNDFGALIQKTGIWLHESDALGASPDGLVLHPPDGLVLHPPLCEVSYQTPDARAAIPELVEVKCPYSAASLSVEDPVHCLKDFYLEFKEDSLHLKTDHAYYHQIQGQLYMCNKNCCDLMVWTPVDCAIIRIVKDKEWAKNVTVLVDFYFSTLFRH